MTPTRRSAVTAALLSAGAGAIHVAAAVPHFGDDTLLGTAFTLTAWLQLAVSVALLVRPTRLTALAGIGIHVGALAGWAMSRTVGLPVGHPGAEPVGIADGLTVLLEVAASVALATMLARNPSRMPMAFGTASLVALLSLGGATAAIADLGTGGHADGDAHRDEGAMVAEDHHAEDGDVEAIVALSHGHDDGSVHVHAVGEPHTHADGTLHVHDPEPMDADGTETHDAPVDDPGASDHGADGHTH